MTKVTVMTGTTQLTTTLGLAWITRMNRMTGISWIRRRSRMKEPEKDLIL